MSPGPTKPLLALRRHETVTLCEALGLAVATDPTNADPSFRRNRIRHEALPLLADIAQRDPVNVLARTADVLRHDLDLLDGLAAEIDPTDARQLTAAHPALASRAVRRWLAADGYAPDAAAVERVLAVAAGTPSRVRARRRTPGRTFRPAAPSGRSGPVASAPWDDPRSVDRTHAAMPPKLRGKWALGITPRHFTWILKDKLAICERPGGYGDSHRRVRRQEEIIWIRENGFNYVISIIQAPHNLHNYDELTMPYRHRPFKADDLEPWLRSFYREIDDLMKAGAKLIVHGEELGDRLVGIMGGYIRWADLVADDTKAIAVTERLTGRQLDPFARNIVMMATSLR